MNTKAYNQIIDTYSQRVYSFLYSNLGNAEECKDILQDTFETLWINKDSVNQDKIKSYLFTVAYRKLIDHTRRSKTVHAYLSDMLIGIQNSSESELHSRDILKKSFSRLEEKYKQVIVLRDSEGYSYDEIGSITGFTSGQVRTNLFRGRKKLREIIEKIENYKL